MTSQSNQKVEEEIQFVKDRLSRRFLETSGDLKESQDRLSDALDEEFCMGINQGDEMKGTADGMRDQMTNLGLFPPKDMEKLNMDYDGKITDEESIKEFGHSSGYYALLRMRGIKMKGSPLTELKWSKEETDENKRNVPESNDKKRKFAVVNESITLNDGKRMLFVKPRGDSRKEPVLLEEDIPKQCENLPEYIPFADELLWGEEDPKEVKEASSEKVERTLNRLNIPHIEIHSKKIDDQPINSQRTTELYRYSYEGTLILGPRFIYFE